MTEESSQQACEQCGQLVPVLELIVDEASGMELCAVCAQERDSCGCSDGDE